MSYNNEFCITFSSLDSLDYFPDNTSSDFYVKLPRVVMLPGDWGICINELWVDKMWYNIRDCYIDIHAIEGLKTRKYIKDGYYSSVDLLLTEMRKRGVVEGEKLCDFKYNDINHKITIDMKTGYAIEISPNLRDAIGASRTFYDKIKQMDKCVDLHHSDRLIYVYTNIIEASYYTCTQPNLLKIFNSSDYNFGDVINKGMGPVFNKTLLDAFDIIHIQLKDKKNNIIKTLGGSTTIQLIFRRE